MISMCMLLTMLLSCHEIPRMWTMLTVYFLITTELVATVVVMMSPRSDGLSRFCFKVTIRQVLEIAINTVSNLKQFMLIICKIVMSSLWMKDQTFSVLQLKFCLWLLKCDQIFFISSPEDQDNNNLAKFKEASCRSSVWNLVKVGHIFKHISMFPELYGIQFQSLVVLSVFRQQEANSWIEAL